MDLQQNSKVHNKDVEEHIPEIHAEKGLQAEAQIQKLIATHSKHQQYQTIWNAFTAIVLLATLLMVTILMARQDQATPLAQASPEQSPTAWGRTPAVIQRSAALPKLTKRQRNMTLGAEDHEDDELFDEYEVTKQDLMEFLDMYQNGVESFQWHNEEDHSIRHLNVLMMRSMQGVDVPTVGVRSDGNGMLLMDLVIACALPGYSIGSMFLPESWSYSDLEGNVSISEPNRTEQEHCHIAMPNLHVLDSPRHQESGNSTRRLVELMTPGNLSRRLLTGFEIYMGTMAGISAGGSLYSMWYR